MRPKLVFVVSVDLGGYATYLYDSRFWTTTTDTLLRETSPF